MRTIYEFTEEERHRISDIDRRNRADLTAEEVALIVEWENAMAVSTAEFEAAESRLDSEHETRLANLQSEHEQAVSNMNAMHQAAIDRLNEVMNLVKAKQG